MEGEKQIVMLPFLAHGHFRPMLHLAILIHNHQPSAAITIATTQNNITKFSPLIPSSATPAIRFTPLPFDLSKHGLPPNGDNTDSLPNHLKPKLFEAISTLQAAFENLLSDMIIRIPSLRNDHHRPPIAVIADMAMSWAVEAARKLNVFSATFNPICAYSSAAFMSIWLHLPHLKTDNDDIELPGFPKGTVFKREQVCMTCNNSDGKDPLALVIRPSISASFKASAILANTAKCIEKNGIEILKSVMGDEKLPVWGIGPLLPSSFFTSSSEAAVTESDPCLQWLHLHPPRSVLFIAFGSENTISPSQMMNLALGLEESGTKFIWAIRPPLGYQPKEPFRSEWLPPNFEQRMREKNQGLVMTGWAPQFGILSHPSTGGFLSHCGWNSSLEGLSMGVPIIGWPLLWEQFYCSKMLIEAGVCVEMAAGHSREIAIEDVVKVLKLVMGGESEKREEILRKCRLMKEEIRSAVVEEGVGSAAYNLIEFMKTAFPEKRTQIH